MDTFGERIRNLRLRAGLSQTDLARVAGVSRASASAWESGTTKNLKGAHLVKVARALGVPIETLVSGVKRGTTDGGRFSTEEFRLVAAFRALPDDRKKLALKLVQTLGGD